MSYEMPEEIDFGKGTRGLHHIPPPQATVYLPAPPQPQPLCENSAS